MVWRAVSFNDAAKKRIKDAASFEKKQRLESLLGLPCNVGPFKFYPLKLRDLLALEYAENKFATGGDPKMDDIVHLLWIARGNDSRNIKKFAKWVCKNMTPFYKDELSAVFTIQFNDLPSPGDSEPVNEYDSSIWLVSLIDGVANEYGWSLDQTLDTSLSTVLQLFQRILKRSNPKYAIRNGITQAAKANEMKRIYRNG